MSRVASLDLIQPHSSVNVRQASLHIGCFDREIGLQRPMRTVLVILIFRGLAQGGNHLPPMEDLTLSLVMLTLRIVASLFCIKRRQR